MAKETFELPVDQQQELASRELPYSALVQSGGMSVVGHTPGGGEIRASVGFMRESAPIAGRPTDSQYANLVKGIRTRHETSGVQPATILNFLPIPLVVNSPMQELKIRIPAAPAPGTGGDDFSYHVWSESAIEVMLLGEGMKQPWDYSPMQLAKAFSDEYAPFGGVVLLRGIPDEKTLSSAKVRMEIENAKETMVRWMTARVEEASGYWNSPNHQESGNIVELHRVCASTLKSLGIIDNLPDWIIVSRNLTEASHKCKSCGLTPAQSAVRCSCGWVLDPIRAFLIGDILEDDASLERLTRAQVEELGVSAYVAETSDERPHRLKQGYSRPMSIAQQRALAAQGGEVHESASAI